MMYTIFDPFKGDCAMNSKQLQYAIRLSKTLNFSQVAEQLHITQPALSKQILNLEAELGVKLFDRSTTPMVLTPAGEHFIRAAEDLLYREDQLIRSMGQFSSGDAGQLTIGITPFRSSYLVPEMVCQVRKAYPGIKIKLHEAGSEQLRKDVAEGKFDFALVNLPVDDSILDVIPLESDRLVLIATQEFFESWNIDPEIPEIDFSQTRDIPFIAVGHNQEMRNLFERLCAMSEFHPNVAVEVVNLTTAWTMACTGVGATILPEQFVCAKIRSSPMIRSIGIKETLYTRQPAIVTRRGQYLSKFARYAIDLLTQAKA